MQLARGVNLTPALLIRYNRLWRNENMVTIFGVPMPSFHLWAIPLTFLLGVALGWAARGAITPKSK
jgi:hypothetical protein